MVDKKYRTRPYRILVGHSLGGLFAAHAFSEKIGLPGLHRNRSQPVLEQWGGR